MATKRVCINWFQYIIVIANLRIFNCFVERINVKISQWNIVGS